MKSAVKRARRVHSHALWLGSVLHTGGLVSAAAREVLAEMRFVSRARPPVLINAVAVIAALLCELGLLLVAVLPSLGPWQWRDLHRWADRNSFFVVLGITMGWVAFYWLAREAGCLAANAVLLIGQSLSFPILLIVRSMHRLVASWRVQRRILDVLGCWLPPAEVTLLCGQILPDLSTADAITWNRLTPGQTISRWIELQSSVWLKYLPDQAWAELVTADLSPSAMAKLFGQCLRRDGFLVKSVSAVLIAHNWFADQERATHLVQELAALPSDQLAAALEMISELSRPQHKHTMHSVLDGVQKLGDGEAVRRFQSAIVLASAETFEDAFLAA